MFASSMNRVRRLVAGSALEPAARAVYGRICGDARNAGYDRETLEVMERALRPDSNCVDVGSHSGSMLRHMLRLAPQGRHHAFEPLPDLCAGLARRYGNRAHIHCLALSDATGDAAFQHAVDRPAYSGFRRRGGANHVREITVRADTLDRVLAPDERVDFVKIDVEGGELQVLRGAVATLARWRPLVVFEHGIGAAAEYGPAMTDDIFLLLRDRGHMQVSLLSAWLAGAAPLSREAFGAHVFEGTEYYFIAHPARDEAAAPWQ